MNHKFKAFFLFALVILLTGVFIAAIQYESDSSAPLNVLSQQAYDAIVSNETKIDRSEQTGTLYHNGVAAAYADGRYYISVSADAESALACVGFRGGRYQAAFAPDNAFSNFTQAVAGGHVFDLVVSNGEAYFVESVVFTTLPVVNITASCVSDVESWSSITLVSPEYESVDAYCSYHVRGSISTVFDKLSYHVSLYNTASRKCSRALLGMRESDEWNLVSLYSDPSRLRNKVTIDLWNDLAATNPQNDEPGSSMEFCEVVLDGTYCGVYGLMSHVDETSLQIESAADTLLYKAPRLITADLLESYALDPTDIAIMFELNYPQAISDTNDPAWDIARDYIARVYGGETPTKESYTQFFNLSNAVDYSLFISCCNLADNTNKNFFLLWRPESDGVNRVTRIPWDLDLSFGNYFYREATTRSAFYPERYDSDLAALDVAALLAAEPEYTAPLLASRWAELRGGVLSEDAIVGAFTGTQAELLASGAYLREADCWPDSPVDSDLGELFSFIHARLNYLDGYFTGLTEDESK